MSSALLVVLCVYVVFGIALTVGVFGNLPILIEHVGDLAKMVLLWPIMLWIFVGPGAVFVAGVIWAAICWPLYWALSVG